MKKLIAILLLFTGIPLLAADIHIIGVSSLPGKPIRVIVKSDLISNLERTIAQTTTDFKGSFTLSFPLQDITYAEIAVGLDRVEFLLQPGGKYTIELSIKKTDQQAYFDEQALNLKLIKAVDGGVSEQIENINFIYNTFIIKHFNDLYRLRRISFLDTLAQEMAKVVNNTADPFVKEYLHYKMASLDPVVRKMTLQQMYKRYFENKAIPYNNPEYMTLFRELFAGYLLDNRLLSLDGFVQATAEGLPQLLQFVEADSMLKSDSRFKELWILMQLNDLFYHPAFPVGSILKVLRSLNQQSHYNEHQMIASNIIEKKQHLAYGFPAPDFNLTNVQKQKVRLSDFKGFTLISFVNDNCIACEKEVRELKRLYEIYGKNFQFVTISTKEAFDSSVRFFNDNNIEWPLLDLGDDIFLLEAYNVKVFPELILLIPDARIGMAPAPPVDQNLEYHMNRIEKMKNSP